MKLTDSQIIKEGERELIDGITADLDWETIEKIFKEKHHIAIDDNVEYTQGDIVVYNNQVAYQLDFEVKVTLSLLLDRAGNYMAFDTKDMEPGEETAQKDVRSNASDLSISGTDMDPMPDDDPQDSPCMNPNAGVKENMSQMASQLADMMTEINSSQPVAESGDHQKSNVDD